MNLLEKLQSDYKEFNISKELSIHEVNALGYLITDKMIPIGDPVIFQLAQLVDETKKKPAPFSYLYHIKSNSGYIMPRSFDEYLPYIKKKKSKPTESPIR